MTFHGEYLLKHHLKQDGSAQEWEPAPWQLPGPGTIAESVLHDVLEDSDCPSRPKK